MDEKKRNRRDFIQNITIVGLALLTAVLIAQTQLYHLGSASVRQYVDQLLATPGQTDAPVENSVNTLAAPVHVAVTGAYGRYGDMTLVTSDDDFRPLGDLLKEALGSSRTYAACTEADFLDALGSTSIYYDFLSPLPLPLLADLTGTVIDSDLLVQRLILSDQRERGVHLYVQDSSGSYLSCSTAVSRSDLEGAAGKYELGNAVFAFELAGTDSTYIAVDPCSLFLSDALPELPVLLTEQGQTDTTQLLTALQFNPRTNYRYPESDGTEVIVEGERSLRIRPDGTVLYRSGGETQLSINAADPGAPSVQEAAAGTGALVQQLLPLSGDAQLYLLEVQQSGASTTLRFGYHAGGIPIRFSDGSPAAEVTLDGNVVSSLSLRLRRYAASTESSLLLPLRQALAIAASGSGAELAIGYADNGADALSACWMAD